MQACRNALRDLLLTNGTHAGLLLECYSKEVVGQKQGRSAIARDQLLAAAQQSIRPIKSFYTKAFNRRFENLKACSECETMAVKGRMIVGLSGDSVLETSVRLHHTYGVPIVPASALKGLAAHYAHSEWGHDDEEWKSGGEYHLNIFGDESSAGYLVFQDAWITPESLTTENQGLLKDILTPHHSQYYGATDENINENPPSDFDDPNPANSFLAVSGNFQVWVSVENSVLTENERSWCRLTMRLLQEALANWGVGGKTSSGYGRFGKLPSGESAWLDESINKIKQDNNVVDERQVVMGKLLLERWQQENDLEKREKKLQLIIERWGGFWDNPPSKNAKRLKKAYLGSE